MKRKIYTQISQYKCGAGEKIGERAFESTCPLLSAQPMPGSSVGWDHEDSVCFSTPCWAQLGLAELGQGDCRARPR